MFQWIFSKTRRPSVWMPWRHMERYWSSVFSFVQTWAMHATGYWHGCMRKFYGGCTDAARTFNGRWSACYCFYRRTHVGGCRKLYGGYMNLLRTINSFGQERFNYIWIHENVLTLWAPGFFDLWNPGGLFCTRTLIANNASIDHGRNFNFWEKIALCMIFSTRYHMFLYLMWFGRKGQSPRCGQMQFVGDLLGLKVNATNA